MRLFIAGATGSVGLNLVRLAKQRGHFVRTLSEDVAEEVMQHLDQGPEDVSIGGPDVLTRRQIVELAFDAVRKRSRVVPFRRPSFAGPQKHAACIAPGSPICSSSWPL